MRPPAFPINRLPILRQSHAVYLAPTSAPLSASDASSDKCISAQPTRPTSWSMSTLAGLLLLLLLLATLISPCESISCDVARTKCAYRTGCGHSLLSYMSECSSLIGGTTDRCHARCQNALVALVSSEEGDDLVNCDCEGSKHCERQKQRIEACRPAVYTAIAKDSIVSCTTARWICTSDTLCRTALEYYHVYCRGLFQGNKCNARCKNSLSILERQEKASKLRTCYCDGTEDFPCKRVKYNTERYCYGRIPPPGEQERHDNAIEVIGSDAFHHRKRHNGKHNSRLGDTANGAHSSTASLCLLLLSIWVTLLAN